MINKKKPHLAVDVTTLTKWNRPPVGIVRTQLEFVNYLIEEDPTALYFKFNDNRDDLLEVTQIEIEKIIFDLLNFEDKKSNITSHRIKFDLKSSIFKITIFQKVIEVYKRDGIKSVLKKSYLKISSPMLNSFLKRVYLKLFSNQQLIGDSIDLRVIPNEIRHSKIINPSFLTSDTTVVSMGLDWDHSNYSLLFWLKKKIGFKFVSTFYDAIPVTHPDLVASHDFSKMFFSHIYYLLHLSDKIFCISDYSKNQLIQIADQHYIADLPILKTIHLGDSVSEKKFIETTLNRPHKKSNYILYVSTIEARKNHKLLLSVWKNLMREKELDLPDLVLVGMMGWGVDEFKEIYKSDKDLQKTVHLYHDVEDRELVSLYRNAKFTLFPSFVEGWGLGAVESMIYGKPSIISNTPALIEATQSLMPFIEAEDIKGWEDMIRLFIKEPNEIEKLQEIIKNRFKSRSWREFAQEFEKFAKDKA